MTCASSSCSCCLSHSNCSDDRPRRRAGMGEPTGRRHKGQGKVRPGVLVAAVLTKHCVQNWWPHEVVVVLPSMASWQMGQAAGPASEGGGGGAMPLGAGELVLWGRAAGVLEPEGIAAGPPGARSAKSRTPGARGGGAPPCAPPASTPNPRPKDPLGTTGGGEGEPPGVGAAEPPGAKEGAFCTPGARWVGATPPNPPATDPSP
jgi:hypothetical protein